MSEFITQIDSALADYGDVIDVKLDLFRLRDLASETEIGSRIWESSPLDIAAPSTGHTPIGSHLLNDVEPSTVHAQEDSISTLPPKRFLSDEMGVSDEL